MSAHHHVYVGPYVRIVTTPIAVPKNVRACGNLACIKCAKPSTAKHCDECGQPIQGAIVSSMRHKRSRDVLTGSLEDRLCAVGEAWERDIEILLPNHKGDRSFHVGDGDGVEEDLTGLHRESEMEWLEATYPNELTVLRKSFTNVSVRWGAIGYWS